MAANEYNLETMRDAASVMDETSGAIKGDLTKLGGIVAQVEGSWVGAAASEMTKTMEDWNTAQNKLLASLANIQSLMLKTQRTFGINEGEQAALMKVSADYNYLGKL